VTKNQVDVILDELRLQILERRLSGKYAIGYEDSVEDEHMRQLGKVRAEPISAIESLGNQLYSLQASIEQIVETPEDTSRFRIVRIFRDGARVRHDLRSTKKQLNEIHAQFELLLKGMLVLVMDRTLQSDHLVREVCSQIVDRTINLDQLIILTRDLEKRLTSIEQKF
jgi:hypothetical protein